MERLLFSIGWGAQAPICAWLFGATLTRPGPDLALTYIIGAMLFGLVWCYPGWKSGE